MTFLRSLGLSVILVVVAAGFVSAQDCSGTTTADEAMKAEAARYAAQTKNDFAAMEKMFGSDLSTTTPPRRPTTKRRTSTACARVV